MQIEVTHGDALVQETPLLVLGTWENEGLPASIAELVEEGDWDGRFKQTLLIYPRGAVPARRILLVGLGKRSAATADRLSEVAAVAAQRAQELRVDSAVFELPVTEGLAVGTSAQALAEGSVLGLYRFLEYKSDQASNAPHPISRLTIISNLEDATITQGAALGEAVAHGVTLARDLANGPGNVVTPTSLAETARAIGEQFGMGVTILGPQELREQGFGGLLGVAQGSAQEPRFIVLEHGADLEGVPTICLVGKGITFDTGGISIKPAEAMDRMKTDMSGAAAVLGTMRVVGELKLPLHVVGLVSAAENMPSSTAYRPGDILTTLSGKTIEVLNTDAEGRIVLADALYYAQGYQPDAIIDLATLTGAIVIALGHHTIGLMSNNDALSQRLLQAGEATGEHTWRLPLADPYREQIKSDIADIKNTGGRPGGSITAAAFLEHFVGEYPWAHLDIAGTAATERQMKAYVPKGATGIGVRLLTQTLRTWTGEA